MKNDQPIGSALTTHVQFVCVILYRIKHGIGYEIVMRSSDQLPIVRLARRVTSQTIIRDYELRIHNFPPSLFWERELSGDRGGCQDDVRG